MSQRKPDPRQGDANPIRCLPISVKLGTKQPSLKYRCKKMPFINTEKSGNSFLAQCFVLGIKHSTERPLIIIKKFNIF